MKRCVEIARPTGLAGLLLGAWSLLACGGSPQAQPADAGLPEARPVHAAVAPKLAPEKLDSLLLITLDTLRADAVDFMGNTVVKTPHLDGLAATGRVYTFAHTPYPMTLPAHTSILTGLYPYQHHVRENAGFYLGDDVPTLATILHQAGFATAAFVAAFPLDSQFGLDRGFDVYDDHYPEASAIEGTTVAQRRGDQVVPKAVEWWNGHRKKKRFLWLHLFDPHRPYDPPEPWASRYPDFPYLGEVAATDAFLGPLVQPFLDGQEDPTLIVVAGDHGEGLGEHSERTHGIFAYEATLHVPLVVWGPGVSRGRDDRLARHVDILPTFLEAAGLEGPDGLPGRSLLDPPSADPTCYFEALSGNLDRGWAPLRGILRGRYKLVFLPIPELYDVRADPHEKHNLFAEHRRLAAELRDLLPAEAEWPPRRGGYSEEAAEKLRALGYLVSTAPAKKEYTAADDPKRLMVLDEKMHQAIELASQDRYAEAVALMREVIAARPGMATAYNHLAQMLLDAHRPEDAIEVMEEANERGVASEAILRQLGLTLSFTGRRQEALGLLRPLADSDNVATLNTLAVVLNDVGRAQEAEEVLARARSIDDSYAQTYENLGVSALQQERYEEARDYSQRALDLDDRRSHSWNNLGVALFYLGQRREALDAWQRAVDEDPAQYDTLYNIGVTAAEMGQREVARRALRRFVATAPPEHYARDLRDAQRMLQRLGGG